MSAPLIAILPPGMLIVPLAVAPSDCAAQRRIGDRDDPAFLTEREF